MPYGEGDYGMGDYGQGDFLGIGKRLKKIGSSLLHHIPGYGVASAVVGAVHSTNHHHRASGAGGGSIALHAPSAVLRAAAPVSSYDSTGVTVGGGIFSTSHVRRLGGAAGKAAAEGGTGYHVIKRGPNAGQLTKNRHMHVTNPRALRRAIRRARGFEKLARKVMGFTTPHKPKGRPYFRAHKRKS